jgi:hypothetical protein
MFSIGLPTNSHWVSCYKFWNKFQFEFSLKFKGIRNLGENLVNSLKIYLDLVFTNVYLVEHTCMQENEVSIQVLKWLDGTCIGG